MINEDSQKADLLSSSAGKTVPAATPRVGTVAIEDEHEREYHYKIGAKTKHIVLASLRLPFCIYFRHLPKNAHASLFTVLIELRMYASASHNLKSMQKAMRR